VAGPSEAPTANTPLQATAKSGPRLSGISFGNAVIDAVIEGGNRTTMIHGRGGTAISRTQARSRAPPCDATPEANSAYREITATCKCLLSLCVTSSVQNHAVGYNDIRRAERNTDMKQAVGSLTLAIVIGLAVVTMGSTSAPAQQFKKGALSGTVHTFANNGTCPTVLANLATAAPGQSFVITHLPKLRKYLHFDLGRNHQPHIVECPCPTLC